MKYLLLLVLFMLIRVNSSAQVDSIYDQGIYRTCMVHLPPDYSVDTEYPLVMNFHGLGSKDFNFPSIIR